MSGTTWIRLGAIVGGLGVILGAFGAHGLEKTLSGRSLEVYETAVRYQMYHAPALLAVGLLSLFGRTSRSTNLAGWSFLLGTAIFSGSLYALALTGIRQLGMITPFGGLALIFGWISLALAAGPAGKPSGVEV